MANNYLTEVTSSTSEIGVGHVTIQVPIAAAGNAVLVIFARASFDVRITSYAIYNFSTSEQESSPSNDVLALSPLNSTLSLTTSSIDLTIQKVYVFYYANQDNLTQLQSTNQFQIPKIIDNSPLVLIATGSNGNGYFQSWVAYPQVPLKAGSGFEFSEKNVFSYVSTINRVLYKVDISFGDVQT